MLKRYRRDVLTDGATVRLNDRAFREDARYVEQFVLRTNTRLPPAEVVAASTRSVLRDLEGLETGPLTINAKRTFAAQRWSGRPRPPSGWLGCPCRLALRCRSGTASRPPPHDARFAPPVEVKPGRHFDPAIAPAAGPDRGEHRAPPRCFVFQQVWRQGIYRRTWFSFSSIRLGGCRRSARLRMPRHLTMRHADIVRLLPKWDAHSRVAIMIHCGRQVPVCMGSATGLVTGCVNRCSVQAPSDSLRV